MTYLEKLKEDHPDRVIGDIGMNCPNCYNYSSEDEDDAFCPGHSCVECWNREIPGTGKTKKTTKTKREKETMKRTNDELEQAQASDECTKPLTHKELIDKKNEEIAQLKKEMADLEKLRQYDNTAHEIHLVNESFKNNGFNDEEALKLTLALIDKMLPRIR